MDFLGKYSSSDAVTFPAKLSLFFMVATSRGFCLDTTGYATKAVTATLCTEAYSMPEKLIKYDRGRSLSWDNQKLGFHATVGVVHVDKAGSHDRLDLRRERTVIVVCGDISSHRRLLSDSSSKAAGLVLIRCIEDRDKVLITARQQSAALIVARESFIGQLHGGTVSQMTKHGTGAAVMAVLESESTDNRLVAKMLRLGCRGVLPKYFQSKLFRRAVLTVVGGQLWAPPEAISELLSELLRAEALKVENGLTTQEAHILELALKGYKNSAIADALSISPETVRWHKRRLNRKLRGGNPERLPEPKVSLPFENALQVDSA